MKLLPCIFYIFICQHICLFAGDPLFNRYAFYERYLREYLLPASKKVKISNWQSPTLEDYKALQHYLRHANRPEIDLLVVANIDERKKRIREFSIITEQQVPIFKTLYYNQDPSDLEKCIVTYVSFNRNYEKGLQNLIESLKEQNFKGHLIYRVGGFPSGDEHSLELFDVPYVFKILALLEAKKMGYQRCLWLDASVKPLKNLDPIFEQLKEQGICFFTWKQQKVHQNVCSDFVAQYLGSAVLEINRFSPVSATVLGFDFKNDTALTLFEKWYGIAKKRIGFLSFTPEELPLSILINQGGLLSRQGDPEWFQVEKDKITNETILFVNWSQVE